MAFCAPFESLRQVLNLCSWYVGFLRVFCVRDRVYLELRRKTSSLLGRQAAVKYHFRETYTLIIAVSTKGPSLKGQSLQKACPSKDLKVSRLNSTSSEIDRVCRAFTTSSSSQVPTARHTETRNHICQKLYKASGNSRAQG